MFWRYYSSAWRVSLRGKVGLGINIPNYYFYDGFNSLCTYLFLFELSPWSSSGKGASLMKMDLSVLRFMMESFYYRSGLILSGKFLLFYEKAKSKCWRLSLLLNLRGDLDNAFMIIDNYNKIKLIISYYRSQRQSININNWNL